MKLNKIRLNVVGLALVLGFASSVAAQKGNVSSAELSLSRGDAESVLEAKTYIDKAALHENTKNYYRMWLVRSMVYSRVVENKANPLFKGLTGGAGYVSAYSMVKFWNSPDLKKYDMETGATESRNAFAVAYNEAEETIAGKFYDSGVHYYKMLLFLQSKMDTADANDFERQGLSRKFLVERMALVTMNCSDNKVKVEAFNELIDGGSNSPLVYEGLSKAYMEQGDTAAAESILKKGVEKSPGDNNMFQLLVNYYLVRNRVDLLFDDVNKQIQANESSKLYYIRGYLYEVRGSYDSSIADYKKAVELDEFNYDANYNLGVGLLKYKSKDLYDKKMKANGAAKAEIEAQLKQLFLDAKKYLEMAAENKDYGTKDLMDIYKALRAASLELGDKEGAATYDEKIKVLESLGKGE
ncbi:MAG: hypothetical protein KG003_03305 [Bacteroidetes bacterium]|nr:hypothetical protein [Bacteroidota bacterium]